MVIQVIDLSVKELQREPAQNSISSNDSTEYAYPKVSIVNRIPVTCQNALAINQALAGEFRSIHALTLGANVCASICPLGEFIHHHALEHIGLVVDVVEDIFPKNVEDSRRH